MLIVLPREDAVRRVFDIAGLTDRLPTYELILA
jgi:hypothetical protein